MKIFSASSGVNLFVLGLRCVATSRTAFDIHLVYTYLPDKTYIHVLLVVLERTEESERVKRQIHYLTIVRRAVTAKTSLQISCISAI